MDQIKFDQRVECEVVKNKTPGALYKVIIQPKRITVAVDVPFVLNLTTTEIENLETKLQACMEDAIVYLFEKKEKNV